MTLRVARTLALGAWIAAALGVAARAQGVPDHALRDFQPTGAYVLTVDGKATEAEFLENTKLPAVLVLSPALPSALLLRPGRGVVESVPTSAVTRQDDGALALLAGTAPSDLGKFKRNGASIAFTVGPRRVSVDPRPPLVGLHSGAELRAHNPGYDRDAGAHQPPAGEVERLRSLPVPVTVRVFFGSWCPHCREHVPLVLALEDALAGAGPSFEYFGLPAPPAAFKDPEAVRLSVSGVPTAIVFVDGKAVGRLIANDWKSPEAEIVRIVSGALQRRAS